MRVNDVAGYICQARPYLAAIHPLHLQVFTAIAAAEVPAHVSGAAPNVQYPRARKPGTRSNIQATL